LNETAAVLARCWVRGFYPGARWSGGSAGGGGEDRGCRGSGRRVAAAAMGRVGRGRRGQLGDGGDTSAVAAARPSAARR